MFLLVVTLTSMLVAAIMSAIAWRTAREERYRSDARVAALAADIHAEPHRQRREAYVSAAPFALDELDELELQSVHSATTSHDLFAVAQPPAGSRWATVLSIGLLLAGTATAMAILSGGASTIGARDASAGAAPGVAAAQPEPARPLELQVLGHERDGERLIVRGVVRNPETGTPLERLTAVVFLFNTDGGFLSSGRATIDPSALQPGRESPFVVIVSGAADVGRYRVSFRTDEGIVPHVDRRDAPQGGH
jgi:hypothetical protein